MDAIRHDHDDDEEYAHARLATVMQRFMEPNPDGLTRRANLYLLELYSNIDFAKYACFKEHICKLASVIEASFFPGNSHFMVYDFRLVFDDGAYARSMEFDLSHPASSVRFDKDTRFALYKYFTEFPYVSVRMILLTHTQYPAEDRHLQLTLSHKMAFYIDWKFDRTGNLIAIEPISYYGVCLQTKVSSPRFCISPQDLQTFKPADSPSTQHSMAELLMFLSSGIGHRIYHLMVSCCMN